jgi:hypothetical protein
MDVAEVQSEKGFYCDQCVGSVEYFFNEAQLNSTKSSKYKVLYKEYKHGFLHYKNLLEKLEFEYDEVKAVKDDLEVKLNCIGGDAVVNPPTVTESILVKVRRSLNELADEREPMLIDKFDEMRQQPSRVECTSKFFKLYFLELAQCVTINLLEFFS